MQYLMKRVSKYSILILCLILSIYARAETIEKSFDVKLGGTFTLDSSKGSVKITSWGEKRVAVTAIKKSNDESDLKDFVISMIKKKNNVTVKGRGGRHSQVNVSYLIQIPRKFNLAVNTGGGSIKVGDLKGNVFAETSGGSIKIDNVDGNIDVDTSGGSISIGKVTGKTNMNTSGGHIKVAEGGTIVDANTSGGNIKIGPTAGDVKANTSGGNILVIQAKGNVNVDTSGGSIKIEGGNGAVNADTSGGNIMIDNVAGPVNADTSGGGIKIMRSKSAIKAQTSGGNIIAELIESNLKSKETISLDTQGGSIKLFLPRDLKATIFATVDSSGRSSGRQSISTDFPLQIKADRGDTTAEGDINGGGAKINLTASNGKINIKYLK